MIGSDNFNRSGEAPHSRRVRRALLGVLMATTLLTSGLVLGGTIWQQPASAQTAPAATALPRAPVAGFADLVERVRPAVVTISIAGHTAVSGFDGEFPGLPPGAPFGDLFRRYFGQPGSGSGIVQPIRALGSGFVIDPSGVIVTNNHVIEHADRITVTLADGHNLSAHVLGRDPRTDLAVLKVDADRPLHAVPWGDSDAARVGDWVVAVGNPFGLGGTVTAGIVSARGRDINSGSYDDFLQIDAPINRGNSGGPLFNQQGQVIGINTAIFSPSGGSVGLGFAIPSNMARHIVADLREHGRVDRGWLGISMQAVTPAMADALHMDEPNGALVAKVENDSPAARAGLRAGDVIVKVGDTRIENPRTLARVVAAAKPGTALSFEVRRDGASHNLSVVTGPMPRQMVENTGNDSGHESTGKLGLALERVTPDLRDELGLDKSIHGAVISAVKPGSPADDAGLRSGDVVVRVGDRVVTSPSDVSRAVRDARAKGEHAVRMRVLREGTPLFLALRLA